MFKAWPKIPRLENEIYHITEKIDGTNACIIVTEEVLFAQSRTKLITPESDNYGFAKWVERNGEVLKSELPIGHHFGEWWGNGIQRNYDQPTKLFSLFNPRLRGTCCSNVPALASCGHKELNETIEFWVNKLKTEGSVASPGYMRPEGVVVYAEQAGTHWKVIFDK